MLTLLALLSCQPFTEAKTPVIAEAKPAPVVEDEPVRPVRMPTGDVIVRECYGGNEREMARRSSGRPPPPPPAPPPSTVANAPASAPMGPPERGQSATIRSVGSSS